MASRRCTRLSNGFSKKLENHRAAIAVHIAHYNLCRIHETIRCTPAMALGVTDHVWTVGELVSAALVMPTEPPVKPEPPTTLRPGTRPFKLRVIPGGKDSLKLGHGAGRIRTPGL